VPNRVAPLENYSKTIVYNLLAEPYFFVRLSTVLYIYA
jgi:hypothetical protein